MEEIKIKDGSGDKEFFTIIPNYILNHSTHWDREVYIQMKRIAGENGKCYMSIQRLSKKCGMGKERLNKSIRYLIKHCWIKFMGKTPIMTKGGEQLANTYKVENIWKLNTKFYKGGSPQGYPRNKGGSPQTQRGVAKTPKGGRATPPKKNHLKKIHIKKREKEKILPQKSEKFIKKLRKIFPEGTTFSKNQISEIKKFISYWTEPNKSKTKLRWELEKTWDTKRRLGNWMRNCDKFNKPNKYKAKML